MNHLSNQNSKATETDQQRDLPLVNSAFQQSIIYSRLTKNSNSSSYKVKVYNELVTKIVQNRKLCKVYQTNRLIRPISSYFALKSTITSGVIQNYSRQSPALSQFLGITRATFFKQIKILETLGLAKRFPSGALVLTPYKKMMEIFDFVSEETTILNYTPGQHKLYMVLEGLPIQQKIKDQERALTNRIDSAPGVKEYLEKTISNFNRETLLAQQILNFINNTPDDLQDFFNADNQLKARTIFGMFQFKSYRSVSYLKKKLKKAGICDVEKDRRYVSEARGRSKKRYIAYLDELKATMLYLPDKFIFSHEIYC